MTAHAPAPAAPSEVEALLMQARRHTVELSQCALFVDSAPLARAMTEAADWLRDTLTPALHDRQQHAAATAAAVQAERDACAAICSEQAKTCAADKMPEGWAAAATCRDAILKRIRPTPSPERGEAQQQGGEHG